MRAHRLAIAAAALLAACARPELPWSSPPAVAVDLVAHVAPQKVTLLQPITVELDLYKAKPDMAVELDTAVDPADFLCETTTLPEAPFGDGRWQRTVLVLRPLRGPGTLTVPSFRVKQKDGEVAATSKEQAIEVVSALGDHGGELEAPGGPFAARTPWLLYAGIGAAVVVVFGGILFFTRRRARAVPRAIAVPPHVRALRELARLRTAPRGTAAQIEAFYVDVSLVLRVYLEERFGLCAPERTTEEFLRELESGAALARESRAELQQFLQQCDLVKFAGFLPLEKEHLATFAIAEAFVERTRADLDPEAGA